VDARVARGMLGFGGKSYVQTLAATLHLRIDQYMIGMFLDPAQVGLYAIAVNLGNLLLKVPDAAGTVLFPRLAEAAEADAHAATSRVCRHTLFVTTAMALGLALFGGLAVRILYGARYMGAVPPLLLMLPGVVMISLYLLLTRNFTSRNRQGVNIAAAATALTINVALNCVLIPRWGIAGAALASTASYSAAALILLFVFVRESGYTVTETVLVRPAEIGGYVRLAARVRGLVGAAGD
jgi:O-antigen/teichoic acid export membrane protein